MAIRPCGSRRCWHCGRHGRGAIVDLLAEEQGRIAYLAAWEALRTTAGADELRELARDPRDGVGRGALLALLEEGALTAEEAAPFAKDAETAKIAALFLAKSERGTSEVARERDDGWPLRIAPLKVKTASGRPTEVAELRFATKAYGFLAIHPTGPPPNAQDVSSEPFTIPAGEEFKMRAAFLFHRTPTSENWDAAATAKTIQTLLR